jgi:hypothetical protein
MCPSNGFFQIGGPDNLDFADNPYNITEPAWSAAVASGETYREDEYIVGDGLGKYGDYDKLPVCSCNKIITQVSPPGNHDIPLPYEGSTNNPLCEDRAPEIEDLLCGSLTTSSDDFAKVNDKEQFHLFPQRITEDNYYELTRDYFDGDKFSYRKGNNTGDSGFGLEDEMFWGTDPRNPSTAGNGKSDEANVAGLGAETFTWTYQAGDEVGVAVEGTSNVGTKFPDSSRMIMWAFSKGFNAVTNSKDETDVACQPKYSGFYPFQDWVNARRVPFFGALPDMLEMPTGFMDFDRCIEKSAVPVIPGGENEGAQPKTIEVELSVSPENPLNDENGGGQGDVVDVQTAVTGAMGTDSDLNYSWKITRFRPGAANDEGLSPTPTESDWANDGVVICGSGAAGSCPLQSATGGKLNLEGFGNDELAFGLNISSSSDLYGALFNSNGDSYLKISLEVRENANGPRVANSRVGWGEAVIKVTSNRNRITVFRPAITGDDKLSSTGSLSICSSASERSVCPVLKNDIVGLSIPATTSAQADTTGSELFTQFQWAVDGRALSGCDSDMSLQCEDGKSTNTTFVPVLGEAGETFAVSVKASNVSGQDGTQQTGKKLELTQQFRIVEPSINIIPADAALAWPKLIGSVVDPTMEEDASGKYTNDYSKSILETSAGNNPSFRLDYTPRDLGTLGLIETWQIDGILSATHGFTAGPVGTVHDVSASVSYSQPTEVNRMLGKYFGVANSQMVKQTMSDSIQVEVNQTANTAALKKTTRFLANIFSKIPQQVLFFIRLVLSVATMLLLAGMMMALFPETNYGRRRS